MNLLKDELYTNPNIYVALSDVHGWGVFTRKKIKAFDVIQEAPFVSFPDEECPEADILHRYFHDTQAVDGLVHEHIIGFGFASLYNHSEEPNVGFTIDIANRCMCHFALRDIKRDEELYIDYGIECEDDDWGDY